MILSVHVQCSVFFVFVDIKIIPSHCPITVGVQVYPSANPITLTLDQPSEGGGYSQSFSIETRRDRDYRGNLQFQLSLRNTVAGAVFFTQQNATVTITDIDGKCLIAMVEVFLVVIHCSVFMYM